MHLVERVASGIPRMQEAMREANLPEPEFHTEGMFTAVFKRQITNSANYDTVNDTVNGIVNDIVNDTINENEQAILNLLATTPGLNASEISKYINKSLRTTMRYIKVLQEKNLIEFRGFLRWNSRSQAGNWSFCVGNDSFRAWKRRLMFSNAMLCLLLKDSFLSQTKCCR